MFVRKYIRRPATISMESWAIPGNCCWVENDVQFVAEIFNPYPPQLLCPELVLWGLTSSLEPGLGILDFPVIHLTGPLIKDCYEDTFPSVANARYIHSRDHPTPLRYLVNHVER